MATGARTARAPPVIELAERVRAVFSRDDWGIDLDDEGRDAKEVAGDERSPMRLVEAARQAAEASRGQAPAKGMGIGHGGR